MIVTPFPCGRMGNRISLAANFIAHVEKYGGTYLNLVFQPYNRYFEGTRGRLFLRYTSSKGSKPEGVPRWRRPFAVRTDGWFKRDVEMDSPEFLDLERRTSVLFCGIWLFRDRAAFRENADTIRRFFRPVARWREPAEACVAAAREGADRLVAVHMRLTDYAKFNGGAWFYSPEDYRRWMEQVSALHPGHTRFLLFSDVSVETLASDFLAEDSGAKLDLTFLDDCGRFQHLRAAPPRDSTAARPAPGAACRAAPALGRAKPVVDMHAMSLCDSILGPPSTFSGWASFMGRVPRLQIKSRDQVVREEDFVVPEA